MATDFIMPRLPDQHQAALYRTQVMSSYSPPYAQAQSQEQSQKQAQGTRHQPQQPSITAYPPLQRVGAAHQHSSSAQISPLSTSNSGSPTSPRYHGRLVRPLYIPAVLRPTEFPSREPPAPRSNPVADGEPAVETDEDRPLRSSSFISLSGLSALSRLSRRSTGECSSKAADGGWNLELFPVPTGPPRTNEWKPDSRAEICDDATCKRRFGTWWRRRHCRKCGNIFCDPHSSFQIPLDQDLRFNPRADPVRACAHCHGLFQLWRSRTNSQASSDGSASQTGWPATANVRHDGSNAGAASSAPATSAATPVPALSAAPVVASPTAMKPTPGRVKEVAMSLPRDWNWSTF